MTRDDFNEVLHKIMLLEGRQFTEAEGDAWFEILGDRELSDTLTAVVAFHSKPFTHRAYPGDINTLVEDIEMERVHAIGDLEMNGADWAEPTAPGVTLRELYRRVRKGHMSAAVYAIYRDSGFTLTAFLAQQEVSASA